VCCKFRRQHSVQVLKRWIFHAKLYHSTGNAEIAATTLEVRRKSEEDVDCASLSLSSVAGLGVGSDSGTGVPSDAPVQSMMQLPLERSLT
jgi:hypothetical protein